MEHPWNITIGQARLVQEQLSGLVVAADQLDEIRFVAGVDLSGVRSGGEAVAAAVLFSFPALQHEETSRARGLPEFPYVAGFLSFREAPLMLAALRGLGTQPDLILVDGQGRAHPRRLGIASHLGLIVNRPTIGCAKSRLVGRYEDPADEPGATSQLVDRGEMVGFVLRTRRGVKPIFVSVGHRVSLPTAVDLVMRCTLPGQRIPEPIRSAHMAAGSDDAGSGSRGTRMTP